MTAPRIDFARVNAAALSSLESLLPRWLPGGRVNGSEYVCGSLDGEAGRSLSVNLTTCVWKDFAGEAGGADPVSLYAAIHNLKQGEAARKLAGELGVDPGGNGSAPRPQGQAKAKPADEWRPVLPVPDGAPAPDFKHMRHGQAVAHWEYRDATGMLLGYVCRFEPEGGRKEILPLTVCQNVNGQRAWRFKGFPEPRPLYGLDRLAAAKPDAPVLLVEGEKSTDAAQRLVPGAVCLSWPNGSRSVGKADFSPLAGRRVAIWPDADKPGFEAALVLAARVKDAGAREVSIILPPDGSADGWDLADAEAEGWTPEQVKSHIKAHKRDVVGFEAVARERYGIEAKPAAKPTPQGWFPFKVRADGVYFLEDDGEPSLLCSPLAVLAMTRDGEGREWGRLLEVVDSDGKAHRWAMPMSALAGDGQEYRRELLSMGLRPAGGMKAKNRLHDFLTLSRPEARARCVSRVGWHDRRFVLPDAVYGSQDGEEVILQGGPSDHAFRIAGSLQDWQEAIGRYCPGNTRLVLAVSAALAAPLLKLTGEESGGFHLVASSSCGKTTALRVAGSVCGGGGINGYLRQWRATDNALESVSSGACDCFVTLDEIGQADAKTAGAVAYMLTNGQGKARSRRDGTARKPQEWRVLFMSTGEITLADKVREDGRGRVMAGQQVRVVDIQADAGAGFGLFENVHGFDGSAAFVRHLNEKAKSIYGSPLRAFLDKLAGRIDEFSQAAPAFIREFMAEVCPCDADGQVSRVAGRFGLVAAAGELGISLEVLPWPKGEARQAAARCFRDWLDARGGSGAAEVTAGLAQVRQFFQVNGASRFETWGEASQDAKTINRAGFRRKDENTGEWSFYVFQDVFKGEVCQGHNSGMILRELKSLGLLLVQDAEHLTVKPRIPGVGSGTRFYHVAPGITGDTLKQRTLQNSPGTNGDTGDTLPRFGSHVPGSENATGDTGDTSSGSVGFVPGCPRSPEEYRGRQEASNDAMSPVVPGVPGQNDVGERKQPLQRQGRVVL
ncbi:DUF927 domain-containing protein [Fundidesulfovibrio putealis]|uniref:DUF927 domain-containing protein n=1 Tax=Fundidesulfovibrio putealis TaxID=270496 RepID=UPI000429553F|nr:DUF927 domain-containing protein [Fundidesulfovibrio putealis]